MHLRPEKVFLIFSLVFGLTLWLVVPPFQAPDEQHHFFRAYQISEGTFVPENRGIASVPSGLRKLYLEVNGDLPYHPQNKISPADIWSAREIPLESSDRVRIVSHASSYGPHVYAAPALGLFSGRSLGLGPLSLYYVGKLCSLLLFIGLVHRSIQVTPILKWVFCLLGLMPMNMFLAASFSADAVTNSLAFLFTALVFDLAFAPEKEFSAKTILLPAVVGALLSCSKLGSYLPMLALVLLVPIRKVSSFGKYATYLAATILPGAVSLALWMYLARHDLFSHYVQAALHQTGQDVSSLLAQIVHHPWTHLSLVAHTTKVQSIGYLGQCVGVLGWLDTMLPAWMRHTYICVLTGAALLEHSTAFEVRYSQKLIAVVIVGITYLGIQTIMFLNATQVGSACIYGFQGRYLIPIAPAFLLLFYNRELYLKDWAVSAAKLVACCWIIVMIVTTVWVVTARYYGLGCEYVWGSFDLREQGTEHLQVRITSSEEFSQSFVSTRNNLTGVSVLFTSFSVPAQKIVTPYKLILKESESGETMREALIDPSELVGAKSADIFFKPIKDSKGKEYVFTIVPGTTKVETPIGVILSEPDIYPEGRTVVRGSKTDRTVIFKLIFRAET